MPHILACSINIFDFWDMTYDEMVKTLDASKIKRKQIAIDNYVLANLIGISCARIMSDTKYPAFEEVYPQFADDVTESWMETKQKLMLFAEKRHEQYYKKEGEQ